MKKSNRDRVFTKYEQRLLDEGYCQMESMYGTKGKYSRISPVKCPHCKGNYELMGINGKTKDIVSLYVAYDVRCFDCGGIFGKWTKYSDEWCYIPYIYVHDVTDKVLEVLRG